MTNNFNDTKYYLRKRGEMCNAVDCDQCPLSEINNGKKLGCDQYEERFPEEAIAKVKAWHEKKYKKYTYRDDFFSKFPNAKRDTEGNPMDSVTSETIPACSLYPEIKDKCTECSDCEICWDMKKERE